MAMTYQNFGIFKKAPRKALLCLGIFLCPLNTYAAPATVSVMCTGNGEVANFNLTVERPLSATYEPSIDRGEILFTFNRSFILRTIGSLKKCGPLARGVQSGFNTLVIAGAPGASFETTQFPNGFGIEITRAQARDLDGHGDVALALERARVLNKEGQLKSSIELLERSALLNANHPGLLSTLASYRSAAGDQRGAAHAIARWADLEPQKKEQNSEYQRLTAPYRERIGASFESIKAGTTFKEERTSASATLPVSRQIPSDTLSIKAENNSASYKGIRNPKGELIDIRPETQRYDATWRHPFERDQLELGLGGADYTLGAHARLESRDTLGATFVRGQLSEPNWDYASTVAFGGKKSSIGFGRDQRISRYLTALGEAAYNTFALTGESDAAQSYSVNGNLGWTVIDGVVPIQLNYLFDGDYFTHIASRPDSFGNDGDIFSTQSSEFHVFSLGASREFTFRGSELRPLSVYAFGGYSHNRLGSDAPQTGAGVRGGWWHGPDFSLEAGRTFSTVLGTNNSQTRILASINWSM